MDTVIVVKQITMDEIKKLASFWFGDFVKAVVDLDLQIMAAGGELHADQEAILLARQSKQENLWGINLYPGIPEEDWIEFDSMINIRPRLNNKSRGVENEKTRKDIIALVSKLVKR
jgi:poly-gamma-glutamate capsule biosynthesis protein CapA/YwtB (metallophosphatase superfamily)